MEDPVVGPGERWEGLDSLAQTLVAAETALDLGYVDLARSLVSDASALAREQAVRHLADRGTLGPGTVRRLVPAQLRRSARPAAEDGSAGA